jgi:FixJ family two-component response regulator
MMPDAIVYVVDDDETVRRSLARLVRSVGLKVDTFASAQAFLEHKGQDRPSCLVLDVRLPGLSGLDLQTAMGQSQRTMPIIFITGLGNVPTTVRAMKGGAQDFLEKPFEDQELLDAIQRALARSRAARAEDAERADIEGRLATLTPRERQVLELVVAGLLNKQIAGELGAAEKTIKVHRGRVMKKMQADSVAELVRMTQKARVDAGA